MLKITETCAELNCTLGEQILPDGRCCNVCRGYDFCAEGIICGENSECKNLNTKAECECRSGYASIHGDSTYCEGSLAMLVTSPLCLPGCSQFGDYSAYWLSKIQFVAVMRPRVFVRS
ncbi:hypothetical protein fugu_003061 [Takifugu bimaculatus]|uniref:EGF-like domain-containing protein n=1 Tax=Takifugu bimaculatus TaxID=433685 RepID=A0A4Z2BFU7_9TELE|nr:hypothetical protein fugu_003061 [Takifugu bimaculatus]